MNLKENFDGGLTCALSVSDIKAALNWYQEVLGFELLYHMEDMGWCELKSPVDRVNVGLSQVEKMPAATGNAVLTWGVKDIEAARAELEGHGVKFDGEIQTIPEMVKLATFFDNDGNCFMLYQDVSGGQM
ncbi:VOC family protein [candidate division CSSED10-310 bacterium]|uniref:VOC family protein n=1 Tax=candidate division CSSED10-310 bacterium TaxID=2855610 RepID=A0ABV6YV77_UNCC1